MAGRRRRLTRKAVARIVKIVTGVLTVSLVLAAGTIAGTILYKNYVFRFGENDIIGAVYEGELNGISFTYVPAYADRKTIMAYHADNIMVSMDTPKGHFEQRLGNLVFRHMEGESRIWVESSITGPWAIRGDFDKFTELITYEHFSLVENKLQINFILNRLVYMSGYENEDREIVPGKYALP